MTRSDKKHPTKQARHSEEHVAATTTVAAVSSTARKNDASGSSAAAAGSAAAGAAAAASVAAVSNVVDKNIQMEIQMGRVRDALIECTERNVVERLAQQHAVERASGAASSTNARSRSVNNKDVNIADARVAHNWSGTTLEHRIRVSLDANVPVNRAQKIFNLYPFHLPVSFINNFEAPNRDDPKLAFYAIDESARDFPAELLFEVRDADGNRLLVPLRAFREFPRDALRTCLKEETDNLLASVKRMQFRDNVVNALFVRTLARISIEGPSAAHRIARNFAFLGPPGTGKTQFAEFTARLFFLLGVLRVGHTVMGSAAVLVPGYEGQAMRATQRAIALASGGLLFVDEAYTLGTNAQGKQALTQLVAVTGSSPEKQTMSVVVAGYRSEMQATFFSANIGLADRFTHVEFASYSVGELVQLLRGEIERQNEAIDTENGDGRRYDWDNITDEYNGAIFHGAQQRERQRILAAKKGDNDDDDGHGANVNQDSHFGNMRFVQQYVRNTHAAAALRVFTSATFVGNCKTKVMIEHDDVYDYFKQYSSAYVRADETESQARDLLAACFLRDERVPMASAKGITLSFQVGTIKITDDGTEIFKLVSFLLGARAVMVHTSDRRALYVDARHAAEKAADFRGELSSGVRTWLRSALVRDEPKAAATDVAAGTPAHAGYRLVEKDDGNVVAETVDADTVDAEVVVASGARSVRARAGLDDDDDEYFEAPEEEKEEESEGQEGDSDEDAQENDDDNIDIDKRDDNDDKDDDKDNDKDDKLGDIVLDEKVTVANKVHDVTNGTVTNGSVALEVSLLSPSILLKGDPLALYKRAIQEKSNAPKVRLYEVGALVHAVEQEPPKKERKGSASRQASTAGVPAQPRKQANAGADKTSPPQREHKASGKRPHGSSLMRK